MSITALTTTHTPTPGALAGSLPVDEHIESTLIGEYNIGDVDARAIRSSFAPFVIEARSLVEQARGIIVTSADDKSQIAQSAELCKRLQKLRTSADKTRKELKENSLRMGKAIDGAFNILLAGISPEENRLKAQAEFVKRQAEARRQALIVERDAQLRAVGADPTKYALGDMPEAQWTQLLAEKTRERDEALERERAEREARKAEEAAAAAERERLRQDNERLARELAEAKAAAQLASADLTQTEVLAHKADMAVAVNWQAKAQELEDQINTLRDALIDARATLEAWAAMAEKAGMAGPLMHVGTIAHINAALRGGAQ